MRIVANDLAILARTRLGFIRVDDEEARTAILAFLRHEAPLHTGRKARATTAAQARRLDALDDIVLADFHQLLGIVPIAALHRRLDAPILEAIDVGEDAVLVGKGCDDVAHARPPAFVMPAKTGISGMSALRMETPASAGVTE